MKLKLMYKNVIVLSLHFTVTPPKSGVGSHSPAQNQKATFKVTYEP